MDSYWDDFARVGKNHLREIMNSADGVGEFVGNIGNALRTLTTPHAGDAMVGNYLLDTPNRISRNVDAAFPDPRLLKQDTPEGKAAREAVFNTIGNFAAPTVWHGSPHKFNKFDSSKIGTGEGAQAYGHGLYLADNQSVAQQYANTLTDKAPQFLNGQARDSLEVAQKSALGMLSQAGGNAKAAMLAARTDMARAGENATQFHVDRVNTLKSIADGKSTAQVGTPNLYKVDLPDQTAAKMLDWDKPFSEQPQALRDLVNQTATQRAEGAKYRPLQRGDIKTDMQGQPVLPDSGGQAYQYLASNRYGETPQALSEKLRALGIPGIRYLDGGSRATGGTSNYVVFPGNEGLLSILERNGNRP